MMGPLRLSRRCVKLQKALADAERRHNAECELLRLSLRKAEALLPEQWESGFVQGLKQVLHSKHIL